MRKGVSPIISTVVLLAITVSLAFIIFTSSKDFITQLSPTPDCSKTVFDAGIYKNGDIYSLEINNNGDKIEGFDLFITDEKQGKIIIQNIEIIIESGKSILQDIDFTEINSQEITLEMKFSLVPQVKNSKGEIKTCDINFGKEIDLTQI